jgi:protein-tyrosine phosphatase
VVADGVTTVVATAHQLGAYGRRNHGDCVRAAVVELQTALDSQRIPLRVLPGAEVRIDERVPMLLKSGEVLTLGDAGSHLLLELPDEDYIDPLSLIRTLNPTGVRTIIAHPERLRAVKRDPDITRPWLDAGALLQVTAASLTGQFGETAEQLSWELIALGRVALVAADAHGARRRVPRLSQAIDLIAHRCGPAMSRRLCVENPKRVLRGRTGVARAAALPEPCGRAADRITGVL